MKAFRLTFIILVALLISCEKEEIVDPKGSAENYVPTDVLVKVKGYYTIDKVFKFINRFDHKVENIHSLAFTSDLPPGRLQYVLNYLNAKSYTNDGVVWFVHGYVSRQTNRITVFPRLFNPDNRTYQTDWLETMGILKLKDDTVSQTAGCIIFFHVPEGHEKRWKHLFEQYDFVEWAELNHIYEIERWP